MFFGGEAAGGCGGGRWGDTGGGEWRAVETAPKGCRHKVRLRGLSSAGRDSVGRSGPMRQPTTPPGAGNLTCCVSAYRTAPPFPTCESAQADVVAARPVGAGSTARHRPPLRHIGVASILASPHHTLFLSVCYTMYKSVAPKGDTPCLVSIFAVGLARRPAPTVPSLAPRPAGEGKERPPPLAPPPWQGEGKEKVEVEALGSRGSR